MRARIPSDRRTQGGANEGKNQEGGAQQGREPQCAGEKKQTPGMNGAWGNIYQPTFKKASRSTGYEEKDMRKTNSSGRKGIVKRARERGTIRGRRKCLLFEYKEQKTVVGLVIGKPAGGRGD